MLKRLACAGIKHIIIQSLRFNPCEAKELLRAAAAQTAVKVYAGLHYCGGGFHLGALAEDAAVGAMVERWPADVKEGISGWYIAHEPYNEQVWISDTAEEKERLAQTWLLAGDIQKYVNATDKHARSKGRCTDLAVLRSDRRRRSSDSGEYEDFLPQNVRGRGRDPRADAGQHRCEKRALPHRRVCAIPVYSLGRSVRAAPAWRRLLNFPP